jgi:hypothetical protein
MHILLCISMQHVKNTTASSSCFLSKLAISDFLLWNAPQVKIQLKHLLYSTKVCDQTTTTAAHQL